MIEWDQISDEMLRTWPAVELVHHLDHDLLPAASPTYIPFLLDGPYALPDPTQRYALSTLAKQYDGLRTLVLQMIALRCGQQPESALTDDVGQAAYLQGDISRALGLLIQRFVQDASVVIANVQTLIETVDPIASAETQMIWAVWKQKVEKLAVLVGYLQTWLVLHPMLEEF